MNLRADAVVIAGSERVDVVYPILSDVRLALRWNLSDATLQRWSAERIGPPAWRIGKRPRYLLIEVEAFERMAQVRRKAQGGCSLSESAPSARQAAIDQMAERWPGSRRRSLMTYEDVVKVTGLPEFWFRHPRERLRRDIPHYVLGDGKVIRFSLEEVFRWELAHLLPRGRRQRSNHSLQVAPRAGGTMRPH